MESRKLATWMTDRRERKRTEPTKLLAIKESTTPLFRLELPEGGLDLVILKNKRGEYGIIENVFVEEEFRKRGIATKLMKQSIELAKTLNLYKLTLTCSDSMTPFYARFGFKWHLLGQSHCMRINLK